MDENTVLTSTSTESVAKHTQDSGLFAVEIELSSGASILNSSPRAVKFGITKIIDSITNTCRTEIVHLVHNCSAWYPQRKSFILIFSVPTVHVKFCGDHQSRYKPSIATMSELVHHYSNSCIRFVCRGGGHTPWGLCIQVQFRKCPETGNFKYRLEKPQV